VADIATRERDGDRRQDPPAPAQIGKVISVPGGGSPSFFEIHVRLNHAAASPRPGSWLSVDATKPAGNPRRVLCRVTNAWEHNPHEDAQGSVVGEVLPFDTVYAPEGQSTVIYRVAEAEPMEEALLDENGEIAEITEVKTLPRAGASVFAADGDIITAALGLEVDPGGGMVVGALRGSGEPPALAILRKNVVQRHIFIGGGIGSGKSYTRGVIAEELHMLGVPQVNVDVNGEMIEATKQLGGVNLVPGEDGFTLPVSALTPDDVIDAIPGLRPGTNYETLIRHAHGELIKDRVLARGEYFGVRDLLSEINEVAPSLDMDKPATLRPALQRARSLAQIPYIGVPFDWEEHIKPGAVVNIDCRGLLVRDLRLIVASIARDLQRLARGGGSLFTAFSIDEAHLVAPNDDKSVTTQVLREIARIGRHYKIGLILTTQSPQDMDRSILKRLLTRFLHQIEPDQLDALRGVFSDASQGLIKTLPKLPQGVCIVTGAFETIRHAAVVDVRSRETIHGGQTPDIWSDFEERGWSGKRRLNLQDGNDDDE
jgi:DNA helicase HerA-like ATPase